MIAPRAPGRAPGRNGRRGTTTRPLGARSLLKGWFAVLRECFDWDPPNVKHFRHTKSVTVYKEFPGRSQYIIGQGGWEKIVDDALKWATEHAAAHTATTRPTT